ncbi:molybdenum ABC transporter ATP-binding protein [Kaarinaea lacus]
MTIDARYKLRLDRFELDVTFSVPSRGVTALFGASGCGKTTTLRSIAGLLQSQQGFFRLENELWQDSDKNIFLPPHQRPVGYVFQDAALFPHLSVKANLSYGLHRIEKAKRQLDYDEVIQLLGLESLLARNTINLSGGEKQRVAIARALLTSPSLLLMDEPLSALDAQSKNEIMPYLEQLHTELAIPAIYVSHSIDEVARLADHIVLLEQGRVATQGRVQDVFTDLDHNLSHYSDASAIIETTLMSHDDSYCLSHLAFSNHILTVPCLDKNKSEFHEGNRIRVIIHARDVSLALQHARGTSILNIFPARVVEIRDENASQVLVKLDIDGHMLLSRITRKSAEHLQLEPNLNLFAQVKSAALI